MSDAKNTTGCEDSDVAEPIKSLSRLLSWRKEDMLPLLQAAVEDIPPLPTYTGHHESRPRTLVCHDMKGGYTDDRFLSGCGNSSAYRMVHWSGIDYFVYFSHHFITIPPPGWTTAGHTNGVSMLGTVITESTDGEELCKEMFSSLQQVEQVVRQLVAVAACHQLQGWLINIENELQPTAVGLVLVFLQRLTAAMKALDRCSLVIWYDSVTTDGKLKWQDELNHNNSCFYEACDAIFLNYSWKVEQLQASRQYANSSAAALAAPTIEDATSKEVQVVRGASSSTSDASSKGCSSSAGRTSVVGEETKVFVGVDVFGRNFYEGGGFNTCKALQVIRSHGLSAAIFAPAWTHETLGSAEFPVHDSRLWRSVQPYLQQHGPAAWPVCTSFSQGCGEARYCRGQVARRESWFNLREQSLMPQLWEADDGSGVALCASDAFSGASSVVATNSSLQRQHLRLWSSCRLVCGNELVRARLAYKAVSAVERGAEGGERLAVDRLVLTPGRGGGSSLSIVLSYTASSQQHERQYSNDWTLSTVCCSSCPGQCISSVTLSLPAGAVIRLGLLALHESCRQDRAMDDALA